MSECELVQTLADTQWRLNRIPALEMNIYALGRLQFASQFVLQDPDVAAGLLEAHVFLTYQKQLNNLSIQENRLRRNFQKDSAELAQLQKERRERERKASAPAQTGNERTGRGAPVVRDSNNGFEFSTVGQVANLQADRRSALETEPDSAPRASAA